MQLYKRINDLPGRVALGGARIVVSLVGRPAQLRAEVGAVLWTQVKRYGYRRHDMIQYRSTTMPDQLEHKQGAI